MSRPLSSFFITVVLAGAVAATGCAGSDPQAAANPPAAPPPIAASPVEAAEQPITRFIRATGSLTAEEQADVAAEIAGRVTSTPVERGTRVTLGTELVRLSAAETEAQAKEAEANAAQIEARLGLAPGKPFDPNTVPEVQNAKASYDLAQSEFARIKSLLDDRVVSQAEFDQRRTQMEASRQQLEAAKNGAAQQYQALQAARARIALAHKALADTVIRAPFDGLVAERMVSVGDYVSKGNKVVQVVRVNPLRIQLTVPEQFVAAVKVGQPVEFAVDAYPGRRFNGTVKFVSPALEATRRALIVEAQVPNADGELKPGFFATAQIQQPDRTPGLVVPASAIHTSGGTSRVFVINGDQAEERVVTLGQTGDTVEITSGLKAGERVASKNVAQLTDGAKVTN